MKHLTKVIGIVVLAFFIFACSDRSNEVINSRFEKKEGHSIERTAAGVNLHITGITNFFYTTYAFYDTIFMYNGGQLNLSQGGYIHADRYVPKMTGTGKGTINLGSSVQGGVTYTGNLTIKRINSLGNTDINIGQASTFRHDYLVCTSSSSVITNNGIHQCAGEGMYFGGTYYNRNQIMFLKSVESDVRPYIRLNSGNLWMENCSELQVEDLINNANSVLKGNGWVNVKHVAAFNQPLSIYPNIRYCVSTWASASQMQTGSATADCVRGNCP